MIARLEHASVAEKAVETTGSGYHPVLSAGVRYAKIRFRKLCG